MSLTANAVKYTFVEHRIRRLSMRLMKIVSDVVVLYYNLNVDCVCVCLRREKEKEIVDLELINTRDSYHCH